MLRIIFILSMFSCIANYSIAQEKNVSSSMKNSFKGQIKDVMVSSALASYHLDNKQWPNLDKLKELLKSDLLKDISILKISLDGSAIILEYKYEEKKPEHKEALDYFNKDKKDPSFMEKIGNELVSQAMPISLQVRINMTALAEKGSYSGKVFYWKKESGYYEHAPFQINLDDKNNFSFDYGGIKIPVKRN